jgi:heme A synthase
VLGAIGWLTVVGFSRPPYAQLQLTGSHAAVAAVVIASCVLAGAAAGAGGRWLASSVTLARPAPGER